MKRPVDDQGENFRWGNVKQGAKKAKTGKLDGVQQVVELTMSRVHQAEPRVNHRTGISAKYANLQRWEVYCCASRSVQVYSLSPCRSILSMTVQTVPNLRKATFAKSVTR